MDALDFVRLLAPRSVISWHVMMAVAESTHHMSAEVRLWVPFRPGLKVKRGRE